MIRRSRSAPSSKGSGMTWGRPATIRASPPDSSPRPRSKPRTPPRAASRRRHWPPDRSRQLGRRAHRDCPCPHTGRVTSITALTPLARSPPPPALPRRLTPPSTFPRRPESTPTHESRSDPLVHRARSRLAPALTTTVPLGEPSVRAVVATPRRLWLDTERRAGGSGAHPCRRWRRTRATSIGPSSTPMAA
jgi:hypothetical protein